MPQVFFTFQVHEACISVNVSGHSFICLLLARISNSVYSTSVVVACKRLHAGARVWLNTFYHWSSIWLTN